MELKIEMTLYLELKDGETKEEALDRLNDIGFDNNFSYQYYELEELDLTE